MFFYPIILLTLCGQCKNLLLLERTSLALHQLHAAPHPTPCTLLPTCSKLPTGNGRNKVLRKGTLEPAGHQWKGWCICSRKQDLSTLGQTVHKARAWLPNKVASCLQDPALHWGAQCPHHGPGWFAKAFFNRWHATSTILEPPPCPRGAWLHAEVAPRSHSHGLPLSSPAAPPVLCPQPVPSSQDRINQYQ